MTSTPFTDDDYRAALTRSQVRVWAGELTDDDRQAAYNRLVSGSISDIRERYPNGVPPFVPQGVDLAESARDRTEDGATMCTACDRLDNYCPAFPGDEPVILRKHTCEGWGDDDTIPAVFSATAVSPRLYRLECHTGPETYTHVRPRP